MRRRPVLYIALGLLLGLAIQATPVQGHVGGTIAHLWTHLRPLMDKRYFTRSAADGRYYTKFQSDGLYLRKSEGDRRYYRKFETDSRYLRQSEGDSRYVNVGEDILETSRASASGFVSGGLTSSATATCFSGKAVGGGFSSNSGALYAITSEPTTFGSGWRVTMGNLESAGYSFSVYVVCAHT